MQKRIDVQRQAGLPCHFSVLGAVWKSMPRLGPSRRLLVTVAVASLAAGAIASGVVHAGQSQSEPAIRPAFEVASIKDHKGPDQGPRDVRWNYGTQGVNFVVPLAGIISEAYKLPPGRIVLPGSLPNAIRFGALGDGFEIVANASHPVPKEQLRLMLQSLLADRFQLTWHRESKTIQVYRLVVAKGGSKLEEAEGGGDLVLSSSPEGYVYRNAEIERLCGVLSSFVDRMVIDETGLKGLYNFTVKRPADSGGSQPAKPEPGSLDSPSAAIFSDQLKRMGLQLVAGSAAVDYLVVDHVGRPTQN
jgi:uncharacterized protein (TIGR03435 family)